MATTGKTSRKTGPSTLERILGAFEVFAGYGTKRTRPSAPRRR